MKILYLNLYEGCMEPYRFNKVLDFISRQKPDVLGLSELNGWETNNFEKLDFFKRQAGYPFHLFAKAPSGYNLGLFSKKNFLFGKVFEKDFNTGMIKAKFSFGPFFLETLLTHLHHKNEDLRLKELNIILKHLPKDNPGVLIGDLNSLSIQDSYGEEGLLKKLKDASMEKFGTRQIRYDVINKLLNAGMVDLVRITSPRKNEFSVPTAYNKDPMHLTKLRLDYIFANKHALPFFQQAKILRTPETNGLSDHFPVMAEFKF